MPLPVLPQEKKITPMSFRVCGRLPPPPPDPHPPLHFNGDQQQEDGVASDGDPRPPPGGDLPPAARPGRPRPRLRRLRLATDGSFLCRFRRLHAPPLLGFLDYGRFRPALPPHPSAPAARALADAADFYFSFILSDTFCLWTERDMAVMSWVHPFILRRHYAYGCFYWDWVEFGRKKLLLLDIRKMEFSIADLPPGEWNKEGGIAIVEAGECRLGIFGFHGKTSSSLSYTVARNKGESPSQWQMEMTISLDSGYRYFIRDATQRYLLFTRIKASSSLKDRLTGYFSMDVKTSQIQRVYEKQHCRLHETYPYINFPPSLLSSRRI